MIVTVFRFMKHENVTNLFIANLSFGDILVIGFALPFRVSIFLPFYEIKCIILVYCLLVTQKVTL